MLQDLTFVTQHVVSKFCLAIPELNCHAEHSVFTAMHWLLSPEPPKVPLIVPVIEDLLVSDEYLSTEYKQDWLRSSLHLSPSTIQVVIQQTCGQRENPLWAVVRKHRLTASNFGAVLSAVRKQS